MKSYTDPHCTLYKPSMDHCPRPHILPNSHCMILTPLRSTDLPCSSCTQSTDQSQSRADRLGRCRSSQIPALNSIQQSSSCMPLMRKLACMP